MNSFFEYFGNDYLLGMLQATILYILFVFAIRS